VDLFNLAHSDRAFLSGVELAFLLRKKPAIRPQRGQSQGVALVGWMGSTGLAAKPLLLSVEELAHRWPHLLEQIASPDDVVLATPELPAAVWKGLNARGYFREVPGRQGQVFGWLEESLEQARYWVDAEGRSRETTGLLPLQGRSIMDGPSLVLVDVNYQWMPLSEVGAYGRTGGTLLLNGKIAYFVSSGDRQILQLHLDSLVPIERIRSEWGPNAAARARGDFPSLVVRASRPGAGDR
jgi:hypothetical protein